MKVVHVITALDIGGAELMLRRLVARASLVGDSPTVISLTGLGIVGAQLREDGVSVIPLEGRRARPSIGLLARLVSTLRRHRPEVIQSWMYHADLAAGLAARVAGRIPVVWGIRNGSFDWSVTSRLTRWTVRACALASAVLPARIIACSEAARSFHTRMGYDDSKMVVIPNGIDVEAFRPDRDAALAVRAELGLGPEAILVGSAARFHPQKDHRTLLESISRVHRARPDVQFVLCGEGMDRSNRQLVDWMSSSGLEGVVRLLGARSDMPRLTAAFDVAVCSSRFGEAFPNVLAEAMACGVPCVSTNVGDARGIVGDTGEIVDAGDASALADALLRTIQMDVDGRRRRGEQARRRIEARFSLDDIVRQFHSVHEEAARKSAGAGAA